ncbi:hypothetical protein JW905_19165, partial [bacterium]|nr:hypothetical protein [candidate division CSSED10-310 bacterium]
AIAAAVLGTLAASFLLGAPVAAIVTFGAMLLFCSPGLLFITLLPASEDALFIRIGAGFFLGYLFSTATGIAIRMVLPSSVPVLLLPTIASIILAILMRKRNRRAPGRNRSRRLSWVETAGILFTISLITMMTISPLLRVGHRFAEGEAFRAYFNVDYLKHVAVTAHLKHGVLPPSNPYLYNGTESFHYYWFYYLFPAAVGVVPAPGGSTLDIFRCLNLWTNLAFLLLAIGVLHRLTRSMAAALFAVTCGTVASSYEGIYLLWRIFRQGKPLRMGVAEYNVDAATRWFIGHPQIDGLYRTFIYTPQHLFALGLLVLVMLYMGRPRHGTRPGIAGSLGAGLLTGAIFGFSSFIGLAAQLWLWSICALHAYQHRRIIMPALPVLASAAPFLLHWRLGILFSRPGAVFLQPQWDALHRLPLFLLLNFGPLLILAPFGLYAAVRRRSPALQPVIVLLFISFVMVFFVQVKGFPSDMGLKLGLLIVLGFTVLTAESWTTLTRRRLYLSWLVVMMIAAMPTTIMDAWNSGDVHNPDFTTIVSQADLAACAWIRNNLPATALVQSEPYERGAAYSLIPTFAEHPACLGDRMHSRIFLGDEGRADELEARILDLFLERDPSTLPRRMAALELRHLLAGATERKRFRGCREVLSQLSRTYLGSDVLVTDDRLPVTLAWLDPPSVTEANPFGFASTLLITGIDTIDNHFRLMVRVMPLAVDAPQAVTIRDEIIEVRAGQHLELSTGALWGELPPAEAFQLQALLYHVADQIDLGLDGKASPGRLHENCHTTGRMAIIDGVTHVRAAITDPPGVLLGGRLGFFPPGHVSVSVRNIVQGTESPEWRLKLYQGSDPKACTMANGDFTGHAGTVSYTLVQPRLVSIELEYSGGGMTVGELSFRWHAAQAYDLPLANVTTRIEHQEHGKTSTAL